MNINGILTRKGVSVDKKSLTAQQFKKLCKDLTVKPKTHPDYGNDVESFKLYKITKNNVYIPRYYNSSILNSCSSELDFTTDTDFNFTGQLRQNQKQIVDSCLTDIKNKGGGIISVPCGYGKTTMSLYIAAQLKLKTLVVVHKTFLQNQWYDRIKQFTDARIGMIRQNKVDVKNKDIVIGMLQSISMIDYDEDIFKDFQLIICDEVHHFGSRKFSEVFWKIGAKYTVGLSATPDRSDGMTKVVKWFVGDIIYKLERKADRNVDIVQLHYSSNHKLFVEKKQWVKGKVSPSIPKMVTNIVDIESRNELFIDILKRLLDCEERKTLVLSDRLIHLETLKIAVDSYINEQVQLGKLENGEMNTGFYIGKMKDYELEHSAEADIIFGTYAMASTGLDIDGLNTLCMFTPKKNIVQSIGRILRKPLKEGDIKPLVVDVVDNLSVFPTWGNHRRKYYMKNKYNIVDYTAFNNSLVSVKQDLIRLGVVDETCEDIQKAYICYKYGELEYDLRKDVGDLDDDLVDYTTVPTLDSIIV